MQNRGCKNKAREKGTLCWKCTKQKYKKQNPLKYTYMTLRNNAKRRNKEFDITLEQFKQFCLETGYLEGKGKMKEDMTIDRIDNTRGYTVNNLQVLSNSLNASKLHWEKDLPFIPTNHCPF